MKAFGCQTVESTSLFKVLVSDVVNLRPYSAVTAGTVEERMQQRAEKKLFLEQMVSRGSTAAAEAMEQLSKSDLYAMLRFGVDAVFSKDSGEPPTDEELEILMDRTPDGKAVQVDISLTPC